LKDWWRCGNQYELDEFFAVKGIGSIDSKDLVDRWHSKILGKNGNANRSPANDNVVVPRRV